MAAKLARSLLQTTLGRPLLRPLASRLASGEAYVAEKPPVAGETSEKGARVPTVWAGDSTAEALLAAH